MVAGPDILRQSQINQRPQRHKHAPLQRLGLAEQKATGEVVQAKRENRVATMLVPIGGMVLLYLVVSLAGSSAGATHVAISLVELAAFAVVLFVVVRPLLDRFLLDRYRKRHTLDTPVLALLLALAMA